MLQSLLIANRGEIAIRVIRACRELGIRSVAVYSDPDRDSPHVLAADEAYRLGPASAAESYLRIDGILEVARKAGVEAIHPGYGFLAEREPFARAVEEAGLIFVGPRPRTIGAMGNKTEARRRMKEAGVPLVPGTEGAMETASDAEAAARKIGFPVLLKAVAGGGGKGMRIVREPGELSRAFDAVQREAESAFGDGTMYVEKLLASPRHVEIQILADGEGNLLHLGERECSIQRRHQKLVEESPSPVVSPELREEMGAAALRAAEAVDYRGAGTVEFLLRDGRFHFLEMNTRIQVEHPVTEMVTGIDLVEWQLRVAGGETLDLVQEDVSFEGHALECRITAEDPFQGFLPSTGRVDHLELPGGPGVRWDGGIVEGTAVGLHYDPLLGKLICHARDREGAIRRMARALEELVIGGVRTSSSFHLRLMEEADFRAGELSITYLDEHPALLTTSFTEEELEVAALAAALLEEEDRKGRSAPRISGKGEGAGSSWRDGGPGSGWQEGGWPW